MFVASRLRMRSWNCGKPMQSVATAIRVIKARCRLIPISNGYAKIRTDADGRYQFKTIKPAAYPTGVDGWFRPPHIHFDIKGRVSRLLTQMYFPGEALNEKDKLYANSTGKETLTARYDASSGKQERDALVALWDVVLISG